MAVVETGTYYGGLSECAATDGGGGGSMKRFSANARANLPRCRSLKVSYTSKDEALTIAERMMLQDLVNPGCHITPYLCDWCGQWHVKNKMIVPIGFEFNR